MRKKIFSALILTCLVLTPSIEAQSTVLVNGTASATGTSDTSIIAAQGSTTRIYVTMLIISNTSANNSCVDIKDNTTIKLTCVPAPANYSGSVVALPTPLQLTANAPLQFAAKVAGTTIYVSAVGYTGF